MDHEKTIVKSLNAMSAVSEFLESVLDGKATPEQRETAKLLERIEYRQASEKLLRVLYAIDEIMTNSESPKRDWQQISLALRLPSSNYLDLTEIKISRRFRISIMAVSKRITKFLILAEMQPNGRGFNGTNKRVQ